MLALGLAGLVIGVSFFITSMLTWNKKMQMLGIIYILLSMALLGIRGVLIYIAEERKA